MNRMYRLAIILLIAHAINAADAQAPPQKGVVSQTGKITPGHAPIWVTNGVLGDGGPSLGGNFTEIGITNTGTPFCINDAPITGPYHQFCLGANKNGGGLLSYNPYGAGALPLPLSFNINGVNYQFPFTTNGAVGPSTTTVNELAVWNNATGTLLRQHSPGQITDSQTAPITADGAALTGYSRAGLSAQVIYQMTTNAVGPKNYDGIRSVVDYTAGSSTTNGTALAAYVVNHAVSTVVPSVNAANAASLFAVGVSAVDGAQTWGGNVICVDSTVYGTGGGSGRGCHGFEIDVNLSNSSTIGQGLLLAGASTATPCEPGCAFPAIQVIPLGTNVQWAAAVVTNPGATLQGFNFGAIGLPGPSVDGVPNFLNYYDPSAAPQYWEIITQGGNLNLTNSASPANTTQTVNKFFVVEAGLAVGGNGAAANSPSNPLFFNFINASGVAKNYDVYVDNTGVLQLDGNGGVAGRFNVGYQLSTTNNFFPAQAQVAQLPACGSSIKGSVWIVTDQNGTPTYRGTLAGGGAITVPVMCNGTSWETH